MPITDLKLISTDYTEHKIADLHDRPGQDGFDAAALKARFDYVAINILAPRINKILDALVDASSGKSGADNIGSPEIASGSGTTVRAQLAYLKDAIERVSDTKVETIPLDSITDVMLKTGGIKDIFADHAASGAAHFITGQTTGTASAYELTDAAHAWGAISDRACLFLARPHVDCEANATISLCGGPATAIYPSTAGGVEAKQMRANGLYLLVWNPTAKLLYLMNPETKNHSHTIAQVTNLQTTLDGKSATSHNHTGVYQPVGSYSLSNHAHSYDVITGLSTQLSGKAASSHNHAGTDITSGTINIARLPIIYSTATPTYAAGSIWLKPI